MHPTSAALLGELEQRRECRNLLAQLIAYFLTRDVQAARSVPDRYAYTR